LGRSMAVRQWGVRGLLSALCALVCIATVVLPGEARADFEFSPAQTLSGVEAMDPQVVVDSQDRATVVWQAISSDFDFRLIQAVRLDAGGVPGPVQTLSSVPNFGFPKGCSCPQVAVDPQDRVTVAWQIFDGEDLRIQAVQLDPDGIEGRPVQTLSESGADAVGQRLAVDSSGRAIVVWRLLTAPAAIQSVRFAPGEAPEAVKTLSPEDVEVGALVVASDHHDRATVAWESGEGLQAVRLGADGTAEAVQTLSPAGEDAGLPEVVVDSKDRTTIAWWRNDGAHQVKAVRLGANGAPGPIYTLSPEFQEALYPRVAVDLQGRVTVVWVDFSQRVQVVRIGTDGIPGAVYPLSSADRVAGNPEVAASPDGGAVVVWTHPGVLYAPPFDECLGLEFEAESDVVQAAFIGLDGVPGLVRPVSPAGEQLMRGSRSIHRVVRRSLGIASMAPTSAPTRAQGSSPAEARRQPSPCLRGQRLHLNLQRILLAGDRCALAEKLKSEAG
jgi:hypothetical protein